ncbi:MAG TPA: Ig-like domain-containing protein [Candidatus Ozemobacteraceae bacterium]|nr:Ig-like domain-containing protein [Candidatus Ozemobacteraceae bacterium]
MSVQKFLSRQPWARIAAGFLVAAAVVALTLFPGCGTNGGGAEDWQTAPTVTPLVQIEGSVLAPVTGSVREGGVPVFARSGSGQSGATVFVEERPDLSAVTDSAGKFLIRNVPVGKWHLIAETVGGGQAFRQRSDLVTLSSQFATWQVAAPMQLVYAARSMGVRLVDRDTGDPIPGAEVTLWGRSVRSDIQGAARVGPVPTGAWQMRVTAAGYGERIVPVVFGEGHQADLSLALTPATAVDRNAAPIVELTADFSSLRAGQQGSLLATALDPDGDVIDFTWSCPAGEFTNPQAQSTLFTAPAASGTYLISVTGSDGKSGTGRANLTVFVTEGEGGVIDPNNQAPLAATSPIPGNGSSGQSTSPVLRWNATDPDGDPLVYEVFVSKLGSPLALVASQVATPYYQLRGLDVFQEYLWRVICRDPSGAISSDNPIWQFKTGDGNNTPPYTPENPTPSDQAQDQLPSLLLTWIGGDPDAADQVTYEVWLATGADSLALATETRFPLARLEGLALGTTYRWRVVAADQRAGTSIGPTWSFRTAAAPNMPPTDPIVRNPASGATGIDTRPQLRWEATDPEDGALVYDVYFGTGSPLACIASGISDAVLLVPTVLAYETTYRWQVTVRDTEGLTNPNPVTWTFTTAGQANRPPMAPTLQAPADAAVQVATQPTLAWTAEDPDGDTLSYDVFLGPAADQLETIFTGLATPSCVAPQLDAGQKYFWCVRASDGAASATSSVHAFTTLEAITADTVAPRLLSIVPADGATGVPAQTSVTLTFSEPMLTSSIPPAVSFSPATAYTTAWDSPAVVRLVPTGTWYPGSYHKVVIAANAAKDLSNNALTNGAKAAFTVASDLPLPSGYRSAGFPVTLSTGQTANLSVPDLGIGRSILAAVVGIATEASFDIRPNIMGGPPQLDPAYAETPEAAFRELERALAARGLPDVAGSAPRGSVRAAVSVGDERSFYISSYGGVATTTAFPNNVIQARCVGATSLTAVFIDKAITSPDYTLVSELTRRFEEGIAPAVRDYFGNEPSTGPDGESRLTILLTNAMKPTIIGLFYGADLYRNNPVDGQLRESNGRKIIYARYSGTGLGTVTRYGTIAHEFQHMVNFSQKIQAGGAGTFEATWLAEGQAKYAEDIAGYGIAAGDANTATIIRMMQEEFPAMSLTSWYGIESYGLSYLFVRFLAEANRYGTTSRQITRQLSTSRSIGVEEIEGITGEPFARTLGRFYLSLALNRYNTTTTGDYGINGLNLAGSYAGVQLPGMPVSTLSGPITGADVKRHGCLYFRRSGTTQPTPLTIQNVENPIQAWLLDQRL